jgi:hypothetical protein
MLTVHCRVSWLRLYPSSRRPEFAASIEKANVTVAPDSLNRRLSTPFSSAASASVRRVPNPSSKRGVSLRSKGECAECLVISVRSELVASPRLDTGARTSPFPKRVASSYLRHGRRNRSWRRNSPSLASAEAYCHAHGWLLFKLQIARGFNRRSALRAKRAESLCEHESTHRWIAAPWSGASRRTGCLGRRPRGVQ